MEDIKLKEIDVNKFKKEVYSYYLEIFPEDERKPIELIQSSYEKQYTKIIEILCKNEMVGFMLLNRVKDRGYVVLDYLAILPQYRNNKFGTKALQILLEQKKENSGIFIEIEKVGLGKNTEENLLREKRKSFYEKLGFKKLNFDLVLFDVIYTPYLFSNIKDDEDIIIDEILNIYESISGKERIKQNCKIIKKLRFEEISKDNIKTAAKLQYEIFPNSSAYSVYRNDCIKFQNGGSKVSKEVVIITGGANGLGLELVKQFIGKNYFVCNIDRDTEKMKILDSTYKNNYKGFIGDVSDSIFVKDVINQISKLGNIKILINNAGEPSFKIPIKYEKEDIDKCFKGLQGMILFSTETLKAKEEKDLKIINIISSAGLRGNKQEAVYCATKWGQRGYTESLKAYYKGTSVKIIGVYPGGMNTEFYKNSRDYVTEEKQSTFMKPCDVAKTIIDNVTNDTNLTIADIIIERN